MYSHVVVRINDMHSTIPSKFSITIARRYKPDLSSSNFTSMTETRNRAPKQKSLNRRLVAGQVNKPHNPCAA